MPVKSAEERVKLMLGDLMFQVAILVTQVETLQEELGKAAALAGAPPLSLPNPSPE